MFSAQIHTLSTLAWSQVYLYVSSTWRERTSPICEWFRLSPKTFPKWTPHENENSQSEPFNSDPSSPSPSTWCKLRFKNNYGHFILYLHVVLYNQSRFCWQARVLLMGGAASGTSSSFCAMYCQNFREESKYRYYQCENTAQFPE